MIKRTLAILVIFSTCIPVKAQVKPVYTFLQDDSLLKRKYFTEALQKKNATIASLQKENNKDYKEIYENMFELVKDLLQSSRSVTEPAADQYIKAIASRIIDANPELKGLDTRIVFSRDFNPNAYSIGDGTIAFNAGLFVYLSNEAEVAFVLSHELAHYYLEHSRKKIDKMVRLANSDSLKKELKRLAKQQYGVGQQIERITRSLLFDINRHSREGEQEADRVGLRFLRNSGYTGKAFISTMEVLDRIDDTSFYRQPDLRKILNFPDYPFRERWIKKESAIFGALNPEESSGLTKKEKDSLKTHPDCSKRIDLLRDSALGINGKEFLVDAGLFRKLREEFIPEMVEETFRSKNISFNLYLSLQLLQEGKNIPLAVYTVARGLNMIYRYQKNHELGLIVDSENRFFKEGYNLLLRMLYRLRLNEIAELNYHFCTFYQEQMKGYEGFEEEKELAARYRAAYE